MDASLTRAQACAVDVPPPTAPMPFSLRRMSLSGPASHPMPQCGLGARSLEGPSMADDCVTRHAALLPALIASLDYSWPSSSSSAISRGGGNTSQHLSSLHPPTSARGGGLPITAPSVPSASLTAGGALPRVCAIRRPSSTSSGSMDLSRSASGGSSPLLHGPLTTSIGPLPGRQATPTTTQRPPVFPTFGLVSCSVGSGAVGGIGRPATTKTSSAVVQAPTSIPGPSAATASVSEVSRGLRVLLTVQAASEADVSGPLHVRPQPRPPSSQAAERPRPQPAPPTSLTQSSTSPPQRSPPHLARTVSAGGPMSSGNNIASDTIGGITGGGSISSARGRRAFRAASTVTFGGIEYCHI